MKKCFDNLSHCQEHILALPPPLTSHEQQFYGVMSGVTRWIMTTKNNCHGLISPPVSFYKNRLVGTIIWITVGVGKWKKAHIVILRYWSELSSRLSKKRRKLCARVFPLGNWAHVLIFTTISRRKQKIQYRGNHRN